MYRVWLQSIWKDFNRDEDPFISCRKYWNNSEELILLYFQTIPFGIEMMNYLEKEIKNSGE